MSAFISEGKIYQYNVGNNEFEILHFEGEIVSGSIFVDRACLIDSDNNLWGRGSNSRGILGLVNVSYAAEFVRIPLPVKVQKVICIPQSTIILDEAGNIWCAGRLHNIKSYAGFIQFTYGIPFTNMSGGPNNMLAIDIYGNLWAYGNGNYGVLGGQPHSLDQLTLIKEQAGFISVNTSNGGTVCVDVKGEAWGCGKGVYKILGWDIQGQSWEFRKIKQVTRVLDAIYSGLALYLLTEDGKVFRCGYNLFGQQEEIVPRYQGIGVYEEIAPGIIVTQINVQDDFLRIMLKDKEDNIWIEGSYTIRIQPFQMLPNIKANTLFDQNSRQVVGRFMTTKSARNYPT